MRRLRFLLLACALIAWGAPALAQRVPPPPPTPTPGPTRGGGSNALAIGAFFAIPIIITGIGIGLNAFSHSENGSGDDGLGQLPPPSPPPPPPSDNFAGPPHPRGTVLVHALHLPPKGETRFLPTEILVVFRAGTTEAQISAFAKHQKLDRVQVRNLSLIGIRVERFHFAPGRNVIDVLSASARAPQVAMVEPHYVFSLQQDAPKPQPANLSYTDGLLHLSEAHKVATGRGVRIAVIDSQIDMTHPELDGSIAAHFDALGETDPKPGLHGTGMASAIVGRHQIQGTAPGAQILAVRVFNDDGQRAASLDVLAGIDWAATQKAQIINMSFAGPADPLMTKMLAAAAQKKIVLIAAAGNDGAHPPPEYPASDPNVVAVTAIDSKSQLYEKASRGPYVALAAPGVDVLVAAANGGYDLSTGTSVACAEVSGIAALLLEKRPDLDGPALRKILRASAHALEGQSGVGAGAADAESAISMVK
ncbi:MAG TPA: S8 family serine peptidase [Methylovirgula sp.]|jgi:subtilisin family serine protease